MVLKREVLKFPNFKQADESSAKSYSGNRVFYERLLHQFEERDDRGSGDQKAIEPVKEATMPG